MATMRRVGVAAAVSVVATITIAAAKTLRVIVDAHSDRTPLGRWRQGGSAIVELPAVQLVTVFEGRYVSWYCREGRGSEVGMLKGIHGVDAGTPVQLQKLPKQ